MIPTEKKLGHSEGNLFKKRIYRGFLKINWVIKTITYVEVSSVSASTCLFKSGLPVKG